VPRQGAADAASLGTFGAADLSGKSDKNNDSRHVSFSPADESVDSGATFS
jgi:hypothetical protein